MDPIERLARLFEHFPGIGPRQAQRFVQHLLRSSQANRRELIDALQSLGGSVHQCPECMRFHAGENKLCGICANPDRDLSALAIIANDADLLALERSGTYRGRYFVLGGTISLASEKTSGLRVKALLDSLDRRIQQGLTEIILAFPANPEGDATSIRVREEIVGLFPSLSVTALGRGLSTGSELEYADPETLKSALDSRR
ncbi:MAG TPA: toprim domain-containing protein [Candidatus Paceibacterota bacterium]|nr:toprim domain-containing protein [Candidatus Paceibacterota bacterium]